MNAVAVIRSGWREPMQMLAAVADEPYALGLLSGGGGARARWSYVMTAPEAVLQVEADDPRDPLRLMAEALGQASGDRARADPDGPPFQGGLAGLMAYDLGARIEPAGHRGGPDWPDLACGLYLGLLAFDHERREVLAVGRGADDAAARARAEAAMALLDRAHPVPPRDVVAERFDPVTPGSAYETAVAEVVQRIAAGEIFQANIARAWGGRLASGARPLDLFVRLDEQSPAPFSAYLRLPGRAVVSNSPERFVSIRDDGVLRVETRPIKGTRPRGATAVEDDALGRELLACEKDRAENLMIVDLMRNDLSRVCPAGSVQTPELFRLESFANVHHLVSTVVGRLAPGLGPADLFEAAFPPGSITGAPKVQAMKVIADYEPARGPYCGSIFWAGLNGACDSSVLIRTATFLEDADGWRFEARAGAGIVADSDPVLERLETEAKIDALRRALVGPGR